MFQKLEKSNENLKGNDIQIKLKKIEFFINF